jgi:hypothetical protein
VSEASALLTYDSASTLAGEFVFIFVLLLTYDSVSTLAEIGPLVSPLQPVNKSVAEVARRIKVALEIVCVFMSFSFAKRYSKT